VDAQTKGASGLSNYPRASQGRQGKHKLRGHLGYPTTQEQARGGRGSTDHGGIWVIQLSK